MGCGVKCAGGMAEKDPMTSFAFVQIHYFFEDVGNGTASAPAPFMLASSRSPTPCLHPQPPPFALSNTDSIVPEKCTDRTQEP